MSRRRTFDKHRARDFRQRKRLADHAPTQMTNLRRDAPSIVKQAKGL
jgi:hypothetical protein